MLSTPVTAMAAAGNDGVPPTLAELSLEQLMNESVTSVARKESTVFESPAAITVIPGEELARFGVTTLAEALRFVPGMELGRINSHLWAISARGFQGQFADKMLAMIDERTVYGLTNAGVRWEAQDAILEDIDRIEVIRGPGATLWGANAVNGVVNIVTKSAKETQGALVSVGTGNELRASAAVRYGGTAGPGRYYRVYAKYTDRAAFRLLNGATGPDDWRGLRVGARFDWETRAADRVVVDAEMYEEKVGQIFYVPSPAPPFGSSTAIDNFNCTSHLQTRWTRSLGERASVSAQAFYAHSRAAIGAAKIVDDTVDASLQHRFAAGPAHDIVWGANVRWIGDDMPPDATVRITPQRSNVRLYGVFAEDDITLIPARLHGSIGSKFEHNDLTGFEFEPGMRAWWTPAAGHALWAAVSRAVRTPDRVERNGEQLVTAFPIAPPTQVPNSAVVAIEGNPELKAERIYAYEAGYRFYPAATVSFDVAAFYNEYRGLIGFVPQPPRLEATPAPLHLLIAERAGNVESCSIYGAEASLQWQPNRRWRVNASYSWLHAPFLPYELEFDNPAHQAKARIVWRPRPNLELVSAVYYVDRLPDMGVPSYLRLDLGFTRKCSAGCEIGVWGENLTDPRHLEFPHLSSALVEEVPRRVLIRLTRRF
ncbi:MAG TPA: TonB-dependent receptor [Opitutaceae bacterium]|nr:TonB-dependent receptor [Opitutaceae bacterium]